MTNLGFLAAFGTALCWGSYMVPFKKSESSNIIQFQTLIAVSIGFSGLIISIILGYPLTLNAYGLMSGALWAIANAISFIAIIDLGLSRAVPLMGSLVVIFSFLWGALFFHEMPAGLTMGFLGIGLIVAGVILVSSTENMESRKIKKGLSAGICAGLIWGSQLVPLKVGNVSTGDFFFPVCLGILLTGLLIAAIKRIKFKNEAIAFSLTSGIIWNIGNLLSLISLSLIGLSKAGPTSQISSLVAVLWGLFYFKEIKERKAKLQVLVGAFILLAGVVTLGFA
ncbi:GRP family sugar transporter [Patescibacteria group bacterium]|nr:GRP family sugar transporter [Patescibacteria group bacterium]